MMQVSLEHAVVEGGRLQVQDDAPGAALRSIEIAAIAAQLERAGEAAHRVTASAEVVVRTPVGETIPLGDMRVQGMLQCHSLTQLTRSPVTMEVTLGEALRAGVELPGGGEQRAEVVVRGELDLALLRRLLPAGALPVVVAGDAWSGRCRVDARLTICAKEGVRVHELAVAGTDLHLRSRGCGTERANAE